MITNGYKGSSLKLMSILMSVMPIILMWSLPLYIIRFLDIEAYKFYDKAH